MKNRHIPCDEAFRQLFASVATTAEAFGLTVASAHMENGCYYVGYRNFVGYLVRTEPVLDARQALFAFEQSLILDSLYLV